MALYARRLDRVLDSSYVVVLGYLPNLPAPGARALVCSCIRGIRVTVGMIVGQIGAGRSVADLLIEYPYLEREYILQALPHAA